MIRKFKAEILMFFIKTQLVHHFPRRKYLVDQDQPAHDLAGREDLAAADDDAGMSGTDGSRAKKVGVIGDNHSPLKLCILRMSGAFAVRSPTSAVVVALTPCRAAPAMSIHVFVEMKANSVSHHLASRVWPEAARDLPRATPESPHPPPASPD